MSSFIVLSTRVLPGGSEVKVSACNTGDLGSIPGSRRSPGEGNGNPLQYSCDLFEVKMFPLNLAAFVQSEFNALICPYFEDEEGMKTVWPLREDGYFSRTLRKGKIYPLAEKVING